MIPTNQMRAFFMVGWGAKGREEGRRLPKPIRRRAEDGGLATINTLIEVRVVNLVVN